MCTFFPRIGFVAGDPGFDGLLEVAGRSKYLRAVLDGPTRAAISDAVARKKITVSAGCIHFREASAVQDGYILEHLLRSMLSVAETLKVPDAEIPERLPQISTGDLQAGVRRNAATLMFEDYADSPQAAALMESALTHQDAGLRLIAARAADAPIAGPALVSVAEYGAAPASVRVETIETLAERGLTNDVSARLLVLLGRSSGALLATILRAFEEADTPVPLPTLERRLNSVSYEARVAIAGSIKRHGLTGVPSLIRLLGDEAEAVGALAATALGEIADLSAVEALLPHAESFFGTAELRRAARAAVEAIQQRHGTTGHGGGLAIAEDSGSGCGLSGGEDLEESEGALSEA